MRKVAIFNQSGRYQGAVVPLIFRPDVDFLQVDLILTIDGHNEPPIRSQVHHHKLDIILSQTRLSRVMRELTVVEPEE